MIVSVRQAIRLLLDGDVVALPTETVYGLAGVCEIESAVKKIFAVKERPSFDPLIVHISKISQIHQVVDQWPASAQVLAEKFWPGPLTLVLPKNKNISSLITAGHPTVAVRMPDHPLTLEVLNSTGPLAAPSANKFGRTSPTAFEHVEDEFLGKVPCVDGGHSRIGIESTIVKLLETKKEIHALILRPGLVDEQEIERALEKVGKKIMFAVASKSKDAPGNLENHYQPKRPLVIADSGVHWNTELHQDICDKLGTRHDVKPMVWKLINSNPRIAARTLYADMRQKSDETHPDSYTFLILPKTYYKPAWTPLRDRLDKASFLKVKMVEDFPSVFIKSVNEEDL